LQFDGDAGDFAIAIVIIRDGSRHASRNSCDTLLARNAQDLAVMGVSGRQNMQARRVRSPDQVTETGNTQFTSMSP
jgi:hypothetical protein